MAADATATATADRSTADRSTPRSDGGRLADLEALVASGTDYLARFDPDRHAVADVRRAMGLFSTLANLSTAGLALCASRVAASGPAKGSGRRSAAEDVATVTGSSVSEAHRLLEVGQASRSSSRMDEALRQGKLSRERASVVSDGLSAAPGAEQELLRSATSESFRQLRERQRQAKARARRAEADRERAARLHRDRRVRTYVDDDGFFRLDAHLPPEVGAVVDARLAAETDRVFAEARRAGRHEDPAAYRADALVALLERGGAVASRPAGAGSGAGSGARPGRSTGPEDRDGPGPGPGAGDRLCGPRAMITLRVDLQALRAGGLDDGQVCEIPGVGPVPLATARALLGDAVLDLVIAHGVDVTTTAHLGRTVPAALRRALVERDPVCVVPGCGASWNLEIDHWKLPFADGGAASLDNLVVLCRFHHHLRHYEGFTLSGEPGRWRFDPPPGRAHREATDGRDQACPRSRGGPTGTHPDRARAPDPSATVGAIGDQARLFGDRQ